MRGAAGLAAIPAFFAAALVWHAASDDAYYNDGQSYWSSHSDGRWVFGLAVVINVGAAVAILARPRVWLASVLIVVGFLAGYVGWVVITAN
jgi:hypothetical protein